MRQRHRLHLGKHFTEGARQIWLQLDKRKLTAEELTRTRQWPRGRMSRLMYGDILPNLTVAIELSELLGINPSDFTRSPVRAFVPPAARER